MKIFKWFLEWRERQFWKKRHLEFLQTMILQDVRWLSMHPLCKELTERYEKAASNDWHKLDHEEISSFRLRIIPDCLLIGKPRNTQTETKDAQ